MKVAAALNRRAFLKLGALGAAAALFRPPSLAPVFPRIASALPLPVPHVYFDDPEGLLESPLAGFDLLLAPAYIAAALIQRGVLQATGGKPERAPGRAHDPDGVFTIPYRYKIGALRYSEGGAPASMPSWSELWQADGRILWPSGSRLAIGAALLSRGYSPNDTHAGHLAQAGKDLAWLGSTPRTSAHLTFELVDAAAAGDARLPLEGVPLVEYDWVLPAAGNAERARSFVYSLGRPANVPNLRNVRLIPLMPLPEPARHHHAKIWAAHGRAMQAA